ncbi:glycosyltransferase [Opitutales bacterium]|nr:glycosyltransferase [Opitutales bacterium]
MRSKNEIKSFISILETELDMEIAINQINEIEYNCRESQKRYYTLSIKDENIFHITLCDSDDNIFDQSKLYANAYKELSVRPISFIKKENKALFIQEYFEGKTIDDLYEKNEIKVDDVNCILEHIIDVYRISTKSSNPSSIESEFIDFRENFLALGIFKKADRDFFKKSIFDPIFDKIKYNEPTIRVSNGDLVARNILVSTNLDFRVIDYEYSHDTHFHHDDLIRLSWFTNPRFGKLPLLKDMQEQIEPELHCYSYLRQIFLNSHSFTDKKLCKSCLHELSKTIEFLKKSNKPSYILTKIENLYVQNRNFLEDILSLQTNSNDLLKTVEKCNEELDTQKKLYKLLNDKKKGIEDSASNLSLELSRTKKDFSKAKEDFLRTKSNLQSLMTSVYRDYFTLNNVLLSIKKSFFYKVFKLFYKNTTFENKINFDANAYLSLNPDLKKKFGNDLRAAGFHYWNVGRIENRRCNLEDFDVRAYLALNPDLESVFGKDYGAATDHYYKRGQFEERLTSFLEIKGTRSYEKWITHYDLQRPTRNFRYFNNIRNFTDKPLVSVVIPVWKPDLRLFKECVYSVFNQIYDNWEICIVDDCSNSRHVEAELEKFARQNVRVKYKLNTKHTHISSTLNDGIKMSSGSYICFLDQDDLLSCYALYQIVKAINDDRQLKWIYSDEDKISENGVRKSPHFKSDWNYDLLTSINYISHLSCIERKTLQKVGQFRVGYEGSQDWDLYLRLSKFLKESEILHIPKVLYHWRIHGGSTATRGVVKSYAIQSAQKALQDHFESKAINVKISIESEDDNRWHVRFPNEHSPKVSILVPTKDRLDLLKPCIQSVLEKTRYDNYEIVIIDNNSEEEETQRYLDSISSDKIRILKDSKPFNHSRIMNNAVKLTDSDLICLFNNDVEVISDEWLGEMVSDALRSEVGCVGAKLLYPNNDIQHAGVIVGLRGVAGHVKNCDRGFIRYDCKQNYSAITGACMLMKKTHFKKVNGFDEVHLPTHFNDVDLCLKLRKKGLNIVYNPKSVLYHHESASRGLPSDKENNEDFNKAVHFIRSKWKETLATDKYYNPNYSYEFEGFKFSFPLFNEKFEEII